MGIFNDDMYTQEELERYGYISFMSGILLGDFISISEWLKPRWTECLEKTELNKHETQVACRLMNHYLKDLRPHFEIKVEELEDSFRFYVEEIE